MQRCHLIHTCKRCQRGCMPGAAVLFGMQGGEGRKAGGAASKGGEGARAVTSWGRNFARPWTCFIVILTMTAAKQKVWAPAAVGPFSGRSSACSVCVLCIRWLAYAGERNCMELHSYWSCNIQTPVYILVVQYVYGGCFG